MTAADTSRPSTRAPRLAVLDALRLVAALAVAAFHYTVGWRIDGLRPPEYFLPSAVHFTVYGFLGVELFFLISGFVICMSSWGRRLGDFFTSRVSRLYPAYWVCILITLVVTTLMPVTGGVPEQEKLTLIDVVVNLTMLQRPMGVPDVDAVYWTLFVELRFYLLFAVLVRFGLTYRRCVLFCAVWLTVAVIAPTLQSPLISAIVIPEYAPYFVAGIAMYLIHRFGPTPLLWAIVGFTWLVSLQRVQERMTTIDPGFTVPDWPGALLITAAYAVMLVIALGWTDRITWRWLTVAGAVTYPFYLLHQRIGYSVIRVVHEHTHLPAWVLIAAMIAAVVAVAWLVHRYVERPLTVVLRSSLRRGIADLRRAEPEHAVDDVVAPSRPVAKHTVTPRPSARPERAGSRPPTR